MQVVMHLDGMMNRVVVIVALFLLIEVFLPVDFVLECPASTVLPKFYVDDDYNSSTPGWHIDHFDNIQDAIDNASAGDRIIVYEGLYYEHLLINKSLDIFGEDREDTVIDGSNTGTVITLSSNNVDISTFTIRNGGTSINDAALLVIADNCRIVDNIIMDGIHGVFINNSDLITVAHNSIIDNHNGTFLYSSDNCVVQYNTIYDNSNNGILLNKTCNWNNVSGNIIYENRNNGIYLHDHCANNTIMNNQIYKNENTGIRIENSSYNINISTNFITENDHYGIMIVGSYNQVHQNIISFNEKHGILLLADDHTNIYENVIHNNTLDGIRLQNSTDNNISGNQIYGNKRFGIFLNFYALKNIIYNNFFKNNQLNARDISATINKWNITKKPGSNIINGPYICGNYWDDYTGTDSNEDGIGDTTYSIDGGIRKDHCPLLYRNPGANPGGPYQGSTGENIRFDGSKSTSPDGEITMYLWDFGDGTTGEGLFVEHNYSSPGTYSVVLTIINDLGGSDNESTSVTIVQDQKPPSILIDQHTTLSGYYGNIYTVSAYVIDNVKVANVTIEYWYNNESDHITSNMNYKGSNYYEKTIFPKTETQQIYCIIYASDISGNQNNSMNPHPHILTKEEINVSKEVEFDGSESFDLDGHIVSYTWDFGDGITALGEITTHTFYADGTYTVTLTVEDNDGNIGTAITNINVLPRLPCTVSFDLVTELNTHFNFTNNLTKAFYCYDIDNDGKYDTFFDPNKELSLVHKPIELNGTESFLLSIDDEFIPEFYWLPENDSIGFITHIPALFDESSITIDEENEEATIIITVDKANWICIEINDTEYPNSDIRVVTGQRIISSEMIWRENGKIYVLDDPNTTYHFIFKNVFPSVESPKFSPGDGGIIDENSRIITITYNIPVTVVSAVFNNVHIEKNLISNDNTIFTYTPPGYWVNGTYTLEIEVEAIKGKSTDFSSALYFYFKYAEPPKKSFFEENWFILLFLFGTIGGILSLLIKYKKPSFEDFIYLKTKKIIPFFRTVIFGPISVNIDGSAIHKAEFYVDGKLKDTITDPPFYWKWNERAFLKHTIEAKVYDQQGSSISSGDMDFYIINPIGRR